ncbi:TetR/AcrR family transcriptional regulator [Streptosporangium sp. KLBMP 9127]|nr:TetR/AcrR family transcriptional regulator [Streptosporangium sp. KLBMP 9127]
MDFPEDGERELILRTATRMFAALGYDGTSIEQIGAAAGVGTPTLTTHFPSKRKLYLAVMEQASRLLKAATVAWAEELRDAPPGGKEPALHRFIDAYIDVCAEHPEIPQLWGHRWLSDASDIADLEVRNAQQLTQLVVDSIATVSKPADADALFSTYAMIWCVQGFALSGVLDGTGQRRGIEDERALRRFRAHMHQMLGRAFDLPTASPERPGPPAGMV